MAAFQAGSDSRNGHPPTLSALILSDVCFLYESLARALSEAQIIVLDRCSSVAEAVAIVSESAPDLLLIDAAFNSGLAAVGQILSAATKTRIVVVAVSETESNVLSWIRAGVSGYIPNTARLVDLPAMLQGIARGEQACSAFIAGSLLRELRDHGPQGETSHSPNLTDRERQVLRLIGSGRANKEIARELNISLATAKSHVHNLLGKLNLRHRGQVTAWLHSAERA
ncbi:LuxR C-terminal-related transcriptional regulator [Bradyrhizobium sp. CCBAU 11386]|uniref:LuxR C-terminal-related transcriptional regulator n=1 Tax=Bradyrhizobium sp. CCBAU 11386 TaxID=1630837 RepID=UPI0023030C73|nr:response regulator transcription factor [Bradyrhizobium sp. CCBAU 11386]